MPDLSPKAEALKILNNGGTNTTADEILSLAKKLKKLNIPIIYFISPQASRLPALPDG